MLLSSFGCGIASALAHSKNGNGERLELTHRATSRELFAQGALRAAAWVVGKPAGRVSLADVLG
jgi:dihydrodipicolinate reductase